jgi:hypothetical protein
MYQFQSKIILEKLTIPQLVIKALAFYGTQRPPQDAATGLCLVIAM